MITRDIDVSTVSGKLKAKAIKARRPLSCTFELTYHCNFRCPMCYIRMTDEQAKQYGRMRTADEWLDMARQCYDAGVLYLTLTGGECTTFPEFPRLYRELCKMGFRVSLMSNAGCYSAELKELFREFPPYNISITLYGGSNSSYKQITGDPHGLDHVLDNIRFLQSIRVPINLCFTMVRQNVRDYPKVGEICKSLGLAYNLNNDITPHGRKAEFSDALGSRLSTAERAAVACHPADEVEIALKNAVELEKKLVEYKPPEATDAEPTELNACIGSYCDCTIAWNGEMGSCISMAICQQYHPFEDGFETAWQKLQSEHGKYFSRPVVCTSCEMQEDCVFNCAARNLEGTGNCQTPDPITCEYVWLLRKYREMFPTEYRASITKCN